MISVCSGESLLSRKMNANYAFAYDYHLISLQVSEGLIDELEAISMLEEGEIRPLGSTLRQEISQCLGRIAAGSCPKYPIKQ